MMQMQAPRKRRAYGQVRDLLESLGGRMVWHGKGRGGTWHLYLGEYAHSEDLPYVRDREHGPLDRMYVPLVPNPRTIGDYPDDSVAELKPDALKRLVRLIVRHDRS